MKKLLDSKERTIEIIKRLKKGYPDAKIALEFSSPMENLVATILSAQCTDQTVNKVTMPLFKKYRTVKAYANADIKEFEKDIHSTGFYHNKAKNIINAAKMVLEKFGGKIPDNMQDLISLPGVARKTANVVLGNSFGKTEGIVVDTHVIRLSQRLGFSKNKDAVKIEQDLIDIVPKTEWLLFSNLIINHGRKICSARKPDCEKCILDNICPKIGI